MLVLLTKVLFANTSCPLQKTTQSHFSIELPASEEGSRIKGTCSHRDNPVSHLYMQIVKMVTGKILIQDIVIF